MATFLGDKVFEGILYRKFRAYFNHLSCADLVATIEVFYDDAHKHRECLKTFRYLLALQTVRQKYDRTWHSEFDTFRKVLKNFPAFGHLLQKVDQLNDEHQGERQVKRNFKVEHIDDLPCEG